MSSLRGRGEEPLQLDYNNRIRSFKLRSSLEALYTAQQIQATQVHPFLPFFFLLLFSSSTSFFFWFAVSKGLFVDDDANDAQHKTTHNSGPAFSFLF
jgi:hypothetical protein